MSLIKKGLSSILFAERTPSFIGFDHANLVLRDLKSNEIVYYHETLYLHKFLYIDWNHVEMYSVRKCYLPGLLIANILVVFKRKSRAIRP